VNDAFAHNTEVDFSISLGCRKDSQSIGLSGADERQKEREPLAGTSFQDPAYNESEDGAARCLKISHGDRATRAFGEQSSTAVRNFMVFFVLKTTIFLGL
jgi:hypothetical protein